MSKHSRVKEITRASSQRHGVLALMRGRFGRLMWVGVVLVMCGMFFYGSKRFLRGSSASNRNHITLTPKVSHQISVGTVSDGDFLHVKSSPWYSLENVQWGGFERKADKSINGEYDNFFACVSASVASPPSSLKVFGCVQEISLTRGMPDEWRFDMRVAQEKKLCTKQYAQAVAIFWPGDEAQPGQGNVQLRCILHGVDAPPYQMGNARFHMHPGFVQSKDGWRNYKLPIRQWFEEAYPGKDFSQGRMRILMEARYDDMPAYASAGDVALEVHYDKVDFFWKGDKND